MDPPRWPKTILIFCLIPLVQAYTVFETNCSAPVTQSSYVSSPNTRGTLDILWSSLFTILACTWTLQHPNVPKQRNEDDHEQQGQNDVEQQGQVDPGRQGCIKWILVKWRSAKWGLKSFGRSALRMLSTIIAPELIIASACDELIRARSHYKEMQKYAKKHSVKVTWSLRHSYYANMGGFVIRLRGQPTGEIRRVPATERPEPSLPSSYHNPYHLNGLTMLALRRKGYISKFPDIKEAEIMDKSKGDTLAKMIALGQIVWSIVQIIARAIRRLPVSPLEVAVAAYAVCAVIIYAVYWKKPQRVGVAHTIQLTIPPLMEGETIQRADEATLGGTTPREDEPTPQEINAIPDEVLKITKVTGTRQFFRQEMGKIPMKCMQPTILGAPIGIDTINFARWAKLIPAIAALCAALFGGIHAIAWNFDFPTTVELSMWRYVCIYMIAAPIWAWLFFCLDKMLIILYAFGNLTNPGHNVNDQNRPRPEYIRYRKHRRYLEIFERFERRLLKIILYFLSFLYLIARLFILVEMFRTLFFLPTGSYVSTWTTNMPHVG